MRLELTEKQHQDLQQHPATDLIEVVDPVTQRAYVLLARERYEQMRTPDKPKAEPARSEPQAIPPGILRSQQAYRRALPELLAKKKLLGQYLCYHGDERIGIARSMFDLLDVCYRRGLDDTEFYVGIIMPHGLIEEEELDPPPPWLMVEDEEEQP